MKKIMLTALMACSLFAFAQEAAPKPAEAKPAPAAVARPQRPQMTPDQRKAFHEKMLAARKAHQAEMQAKIVATLTEAGLDEAKAKETAEKIGKIIAESRRPAGRRPGPRPVKAPAAPAAK